MPPGTPMRRGCVVGCEGVMERGDGSHVPRVTCHGTCQESAVVVNEVGDDYFHELLWELGDWGRRCGGRLWGASDKQREKSSFGSVPKSVDEEFIRCRTVNEIGSLDGIWKHLLTRMSVSSPPSP